MGGDLDQARGTRLARLSSSGSLATLWRSGWDPRAAANPHGGVRATG